MTSFSRRSHGGCSVRLLWLIGLVILISWPIAVLADEKPSDPTAGKSAAGSAGDSAALPIRAIAFSPDGKAVVAGTGEPNQAGSVILWEIATRQPRWVHREAMGIPSVAFAPDGKTLAIAIYDRTARLLDSSSGRELRTFRGHDKEVRSVAFSPDGKILATGSWDRTIKFWDPATGELKTTLEGHTARVMGLSFSPDGGTLASVGDKDAILWDSKTGNQRRALAGHGTFVMRSITFSPDGHWVITAGWDGTARLWNAETGALSLVLKGRGGVDGAVLNPNGSTLALCSMGKDVQLYELALKGVDEQNRVRVSALVVRLDDDDFAIREQAGRDLSALGLVAQPALRVAMRESPSAEVRIRARRLRARMLEEPRATLDGGSARLACVAFSPDGKLLASGGTEGVVTVWNVDTKGESARLMQPATAP